MSWSPNYLLADFWKEERNCWQSQGFQATEDSNGCIKTSQHHSRAEWNHQIWPWFTADFANADLLMAFYLSVILCALYRHTLSPPLQWSVCSWSKGLCIQLGLLFQPFHERFFSESLDLDSLTIKRAHHTGSHKNNQPQSIVVKFLFFRDRDLVLTRAKECKQQDFYVNPDFSSHLSRAEHACTRKVHQHQLQ